VDTPDVRLSTRPHVPHVKGQVPGTKTPGTPFRPRTAPRRHPAPDGQADGPGEADRGTVILESRACCMRSVAAQAPEHDGREQLRRVCRHRPARKRIWRRRVRDGKVSAPRAFDTSHSQEPASDDTNLRTAWSACSFTSNSAHDRWYAAGFDAGVRPNAQKSNSGAAASAATGAGRDRQRLKREEHAHMSTPADGPSARGLADVRIHRGRARHADEQPRGAHHVSTRWDNTSPTRLIGHANGLTNPQGEGDGRRVGRLFRDLT